MLRRLHKTILFSTGPIGSKEASLNTLSLVTGERRFVAHGFQGRYLPSGHIVFARSGALHAIRFDLERLAAVGGEFSALDDVAESRGNGAVYFRISGDGSLFFVPGRNEHMLVKTDRAGRITPLTERRAGYRIPAVSPDGRRIAVTIDPPDESFSDIWIFDIDRDAFTRLTKEGHNLLPRWTPDGKRIIWNGRGPGDRDMKWQAVDGGDVATDLLARPGAQGPQAVSPDGRFVVFSDQTFGLEPNGDLWAYPLSDKGEAFPLVESPFYENRADVSRNGG